MTLLYRVVEFILDGFDAMLNCSCESHCIAEFGYPAPVRGTPGCNYCKRKGYTKE